MAGSVPVRFFALRSIGTGAAAWLAAQLAQRNVQVGGLVLIAPFVSLAVSFSMSGGSFFAQHSSGNTDVRAVEQGPVDTTASSFRNCFYTAAPGEHPIPYLCA